jgi:hypothetical protein
LINFPENYTPWRSPYENHKSTPKIVKTLEIISINKSYGDLKREQSDYRNWKAAAVANVKSNLYVTSETVKCDLKRHESLTWKSSGSNVSSLLFSSWLVAWGFWRREMAATRFLYLFQIITLLSLSSKEFIIWRFSFISKSGFRTVSFFKQLF